MRPINTIIFHQTDTATGTVESIRRYHMDVLGWSDIGYHWLLTPDGMAHPGRPEAKVGAHCQGDNHDSLGICCVGKGPAFPLDVGYMTTEMWCALLGLTRAKLTQYPTIGELWGHRECRSGIRQGKTCPGWDVDWMRRLFIHGRRP